MLTILFSIVGIRNPSKRAFAYAVAVVSGIVTIISGTSSYQESKEINEIYDQIAGVETPRIMKPGIKRMLVVRLDQFAGQEYDMQVFRDKESLQIADDLRAILEEAGWVHTKVYPILQETGYAAAHEDVGGMWIMSSTAETESTSDAREALRSSLDEAGLYDDSAHFIPVSCGETTEPVQEGAKFNHVPCSESPIESLEISFTIRDEGIPEDTLVLHIGKNLTQSTAVDS